MHPEVELGDLAGASELHVGVDVEDLGRWRELLTRMDVPHVRALFTDEEHAYCAQQADPAIHYAGRWCAKEAVVKAAFPFVRVTVRDVRITGAAQQPPAAHLARGGGAAAGLEFRVSIAHSATTACAFAVAFRRRRAGAISSGDERP